MQSYTMVFITINALHVSGGSSAHHQELNTLYTQHRIYVELLTATVSDLFQITHGSGVWCVCV